MIESGVPVIETARLRLRAHRRSDFAACVAMWRDPAVTRYIGGKPSTEQQTWSRMLSYAGHWVLMQYGYWAVEERDSGTFTGELGFADFKREITSSMRDVPELGFAFVSSVHGRGYATEAVGAAIAWGDAHLPSARTVCLVSPENTASLRVVEKAGYEIFERSMFNERPSLFLSRFADRP